ncbi:MAG: hypothetical protein ACYTDT_08510 [Planctomycetota bacterium]|jgi:hypothetical protein
MNKPAAITLTLLLLTGCKSEPVIPEDPSDTSIERVVGGPITIEDLRANGSNAKALSALLVALDRELREPANEHRSAIEIASALERHEFGIRSFNKCERFISSRRSAFREFGVFPPQGQRPRVPIKSFAEFVEVLVDAHSDATSVGQLNAAWRQLAPEIDSRANSYIASSWNFEIDFPEDITVSLADSVLGPVWRCDASCSDNIHFGSEQTDLGGYITSVLLANMLRLSGDSPIPAFMSALKGKRSTIRLATTSASAPTPDETEFLNTVVRNLLSGVSQVSAIPAGTRRLDVEFSYLISTEEARAKIGFRRDGFEWLLDRFEYQPASANLVGDDGATLDILWLLGSLPGFSGAN